MNKLILSLLLSLPLISLLPSAATARPQKACLKSDTGKITIKRRCKKQKGETRVSAEVLQGLGATQVGPVGPEGPEGPQGPQGPQGNLGPAGAPGLFGMDLKRESSNASTTGVYSLLPTCEEGQVVISGGCRMVTVIDNTKLPANNPALVTDAFTRTSPLEGDTPNAWYCVWKKYDTDPTGFFA